jgi:stage II sporulation protein D
MALFYNILLTLIFFSTSLQASRQWPFIISSDPHKTFLNSSKKYVACSRTSLKKRRIDDGMQHVFAQQLVHTLVDTEQGTLEHTFANARKKHSTKVRVLLAHADYQENAEWNITSPHGFIAYLGEDNTRKKKIKNTSLVIKIKHGAVFCNGKRVKDVLRLKPRDGHGHCNGIAYDGEFIIQHHKNKVLCINSLDLEDYICAVLRTESWPGWPLEVNKVFAIACRSYVMFKVKEAKRSGRPFHVKNTNAHQTYRGKHDVQLLKTAVAQTRGVVLGFEGEPILAMFDCCCGGVIPAHIADFDFDKVPYLARQYACHHCKQSSLYSWQITYEHALFEELLQSYHADMIRLLDIRVVQKDKAGLVQHVTVKGPKHTATIPGKKLYSMLKEVKSFHFDVSKKAGKIIFTGRGFGHHLGLCQWGARQMVRDGWDYKSILRFYYPGVYFMHLIV